MRHTARLAGLGACVAIAATAGCSGGGASGGAGSTSTPLTSTSPSPLNVATSFLDAYVTQDGRVLRHDQGDDIVSEGQAYGMLIAELAGRDDVVRTIWSWTREHLANGDGLLAFHARADGKVLDPQSAADADTLAAYALLRAGGPGSDSLHSDGRRLASAVLDHETVHDTRGRPVLAAGPWAVRDGVVNPSYWMPSVFEDLAHLTGDGRWAGLAATSVDLINRMTDGGRTLPPDWARVQGDSAVATGRGGGGGTPQYGPDAQRVPLFFAAACDARARQLAGAWWSVLQQDTRSSALVLGTSGAPIDATPSSVALVASAAAAGAAGDTSGAEQLRTGAAQAEQGRPTYYGAAWLALAPELSRGGLGRCQGR